MASRKVVAKLDTVFSQYIRLRDSDSHGYCTCISCGEELFWKEVDNGHFVNRKHMSTRYHEKNCNAQCRYCNRFDEGNASGYALGLVDKYGKEIIDELNQLRNTSVKIADCELEDLIKHYRLQVKNLKEEKGLR